MNAATVNRAHFETRAEALEEIARLGWWPVAWMDKPGSSYEPHYHVADEALYMLDGVLELTDCDADTVHTLRPGDKLSLPARVVHRVRSTEGATYLIALSVLGPFEDHFIPVD